MKQMYIAGNWKMNMAPSQAHIFMTELKAAMPHTDADCHVIVCPPYLALPTVAEQTENTPIMFGAQNCHEHDKGAYTGEISAAMLADIGVKYCIVGHSERRRDFQETDEQIAKKIVALLAKNIRPIWCVGETLEERQTGITSQRIRSQITTTLDCLKGQDCSPMLIAYEPIWAIGTGLAATPEQAEEVHNDIHATVASYGVQLPVLYGGSVTADNAESLLSRASINGALIGGASLSVPSFISVISTAQRILSKKL